MAVISEVRGALENNPYLDFLERYQTECGLMVREVFNEDPMAWQDEVMVQYDYRTRRISIRSGHGVGKSTVLAWIMVHQLVCRFPQKTVCTAPTTGQLYDALWAEFVSKLQKLPKPLLTLFEIKADRVELRGAPKMSFVSARASRPEQPEAMQGVHAEWVLLIADEASGIPDRVFEAASGSMSGHNATTILTGNPVRASGFFYETHTRLKDMWWTRRVSCVDEPGIDKIVDKDYIEDQRRRYGASSNAFRVRVLGEFPVSDDDAVIPFDLIELALNRDIELDQLAPVIWGLDVARFGSNRSALAKRKGNTLLEPVRSWTGLDAAALSGRVMVEWDSTPLTQRPQAINIDVIGYGGDVVTRLRDLGLPARGVNVGESPAARNQERYRDLKAELWFDASEWFRGRDTKLPEYYKSPKRDDDLCAELAIVAYHFHPRSGKVFIDSKDDVAAKMKGMSPDLADAFVLTFAANAITLLRGAGRTSWKQKISRPLKCLE